MRQPQSFQKAGPGRRHRPNSLTLARGSLCRATPGFPQPGPRAFFTAEYHHAEGVTDATKTKVLD